ARSCSPRHCGSTRRSASPSPTPSAPNSPGSLTHPRTSRPNGPAAQASAATCTPAAATRADPQPPAGFLSTLVKAAHAAGVKVRTGPEGFLLSRTATQPRDWVSSTQSPPLGPLCEDLRQTPNS